ncbi:hypothetical protein ACH5RR_037959 [Cinchona calisaya]|uniref:RRM domain-containing protein n=1 Tax=Cinchona calisaya TaxID=153742 RepID=A0ABD2Y8V4_9GENT
MEVGSPENGFDEISDLFKHDESTLPEDLDLSFLLNKDIDADCVFDDLEGEVDFHFSDQGQSELPSLLSNFRYYDHPGPSVENLHSSAQTGSSSDVLLDTDAAVVFSKEKSQIRSPENHQHEDAEKLCAGYLRDSASQVDLEIIDDEIPEAVCRHSRVLDSIEDLKLEGEIVDTQDSPCDNIGEETFINVLPQELNQSEFASREEKEDVPVQQIEKLHVSPGTYWGDLECKSGNINDSRNSQDGNEDLDSPRIDQPDQERTSHFSASPGTAGEISVSPETSICAIQVPRDQRFPASYGLQDAINMNIPHDQQCCQAECFDTSEDLPSLDHSLHAGMENCTSSEGSMRRFEHKEASPVKHVYTPQVNHHAVKRSRSQSPVRQRNSSSGYKRDYSEARLPYSRGWCKRSSETAAYSHQSPGSPNICVNQEGHKELSYYSTLRKHKNDLTRRSDQGKEVTSKDYLPVSGWQNCASRRESRRRFRDSSSSKHVPASLSTHSSQHSSHQKVGKSGSPSPISRRNLKRERDKYRSRSPHARDYCRQSSRMRYSQRHKSPSRSYSSHCRSQVRYLSPASYRRTGIGKPGTCLFVAGFGFSTTERELKRKFSRFGHVRDVRIIRDKRSGLSRGYGFLSLERDEEADAAIRAIHKTDWNGRVVLVEKSIK